MHRLLLLTFCCCAATVTSAQVSDFISVRRNNGRSIKTFFAGSPISFVTSNGIPVSGTITTMRNDTVFVSTFNTRVVMSNWGVTMVDTFAWRIERVHYKDIARIQIYSKHRTIYSRLGRLLRIGGAGFIFLNVFNGIYLKESIGGKENMRKLGIAAAVAVAGTLIQRMNKESRFTRRRHRIMYVPVQ